MAAFFLNGIEALLTVLVIAPVWSTYSDRKEVQPLLLFLIDGFRWDYMDRYQPGELPGLQRLQSDGVRIIQLRPDFVSDSYPNYYTLMTGLHTEDHGMVHNYMWDPLHPNETFWIGSNEDQYNSHWWQDAEPYWITAEKQGLAVFMYYWPGCEVEIFSHRPSYCLPYQTGSPSQEDLGSAITDALSALANGSAAITGIYYEELDKRGHLLGVDGIGGAIHSLDEELDKMFTQIDQQGLPVNILLFADHGMTNLIDNNAIDLLDYINETDTERIIWGGSTSQIWPAEGQEDALYEALYGAHPHLQVYRREQIPDRWHNRDHRRIPPLYLTADLGYRMTLGPSVPGVGYHGYDITESDMFGSFLASGPAFKSSDTIEGCDSVDVYQIMCYISDVEPEPHNGTWSNVCHMLADADACDQL